jgi:hypothetical protein
MVIRDSEDNLFGVFLNAAISKREGAFYGGGESYVKGKPCSSLTIDSCSRQLETILPRSLGPGGTSTLRFAKRNICHLEEGKSYRILSSFISGSAYGLVVDNTFTRNSSATSPVFDNDVLCTSQDLRTDQARRFECVGVEVWGTV